MYRIIAISGKFESGKDTFADHLIDSLQSRGVSVLRIAFADKLKECCTAIQTTLKVPIEKDRTLLQKQGDTLNAVYGDEVFISPVRDAISRFQCEECDSPYPNVCKFIVITDLRRMCEYEFLGEYKPHVTTVRVTRTLTEQHPLEHTSHHTECELDDASFDFYIQNDGDVQELKVCADKFTQEYF